MGSIVKAADLAARVENESRYWTGYDPELIAALSKEMNDIESEFNRYKNECTNERYRTRRYISVTVIVFACIAAVSGVIGFFVSKYNKAYSAAMKDVVRNFTEEDFERLGYVRYTGPDGYTVLVKNNINYR